MPHVLSLAADMVGTVRKLFMGKLFMVLDVVLVLLPVDVDVGLVVV